MNPAATSACDKAAATAVRDSATSKSATLTLVTTILASSLAFIDGSVVNVALPAIGQGLGGGASGLQWVVNGYLLPLSALLLARGAAGDLYGRRLLLIDGIVVFAVASVLCALAPSLPVLLAGRLLQGVGAAILMPNSLAILGATFSGEARGRAVGLWAACGAGAGALGPLLGGWLVDAFGWPSIFLINVPLAAAAVLLAGLFVHDSGDGERPPLDLAGIALATFGLGALSWGLTMASGPAHATGPALAWIGAGALALGLFGVAERRRGERAMMPLALFASRAFVGLTLLTFLLYGALGGLFVLIPYVLIEAGGYSATEAGAALLPFPLVLALASSGMGRLAGRIGPRLPLGLGSLATAAGFVLAARIDGRAGYWTAVLPAMLVIALGMAGAVAPLTTAVLASVDERHTGVASGFNSAVARTGGLMATALLGSVLAARGAALGTAFQTAAFVAAAAAVAASASAFLLLAAGPRAEST